MSAAPTAEILLAEDNPQDLELSRRALRKTNLPHRVQVARDGAEVLDFVFCQGAHCRRRIDDLPKVMLLDLKMPKVDGLEVLKRVKRDPRTALIPVVMLTASNDANDVLSSYRLGVNSYIVKSVNFDGFAAAVQVVCTYWLLLNQPVRPLGIA